MDIPKGFWKDLPRPFFALAPMDDITDPVFRQMVFKYGAPDLVFTEFVSCDGLCSEGREALLPRLWFKENEKPIIAQFFGATPENFYKCAQLAQELGFDGIDINMGCPDKKIEKQGAGASLILNPKLAKKIIKETIRGAGDLPVSVKTRIGYKKNNIREWISHLLETEISAITIHGRTRQELYFASADWEVIAKAVEITKGSRILIIGNGDIKTVGEGIEKAKISGVDGIMIGRAVIGNPWLFSGRDLKDIGLEERLNVLLEHSISFEKMFGIGQKTASEGGRGFNDIKKHFKSYTLGFDGVKKLRENLMLAKNAEEVKFIVKNFLKNKSL